MDEYCKNFIVFAIPFSLSSLITLLDHFLSFSQKMISSSLNLSPFVLSLSQVLLSFSQPHQAATDLSIVVAFFFFFFFLYFFNLKGGFGSLWV